MENSNNNGKLIGAILLGTAIGAALGVLFAPAKGSETRKKITAKGEDLTDSMKEKFNDFVEIVKKEVGTVKENANVFVENTALKAEKFKVN